MFSLAICYQVIRNTEDLEPARKEHGFEEELLRMTKKKKRMVTPIRKSPVPSSGEKKYL